MRRLINNYYLTFWLAALAVFCVGVTGCTKETSRTYLVVAKPGALHAAMAEMQSKSVQIASFADVLPHLDAVFVTMTPSQAEELKKHTGSITAVGNGDDVYTIPEAELVSASDAQRDSFTDNDIKTPPGVLRLGAKQAWEAGINGTGVKVCVVDTGIDYNHPDLAKQFKDGADFTNTPGNKKGMDDHSHGTHCAGTIAGTKTGLAPGADLYSAKVLSKQGSGSTRSVMSGVDWCVGQGANIISMSLGGGPRDPAFEEVVKRAREKGVQVIAAAGNNGRRQVSYPAAYPGANAIGALGVYEQDQPFDADEKASFSNWGPELFVAAPGVRVLSTVLGGKYDKYSGTSMATPHVAGAVALIQSASLAKQQRLLRPDEVDQALKNMSWGRELSLDQVRNEKYGFGIPNVGTWILRLNRLKD